MIRVSLRWWFIERRQGSKGCAKAGGLIIRWIMSNVMYPRWNQIIQRSPQPINSASTVLCLWQINPLSVTAGSLNPRYITCTFTPKVELESIFNLPLSESRNRVVIWSLEIINEGPPLKVFCYHTCVWTNRDTVVFLTDLGELEWWSCVCWQRQRK